MKTETAMKAIRISEKMGWAIQASFLFDQDPPEIQLDFHTEEQAEAMFRSLGGFANQSTKEPRRLT